MIFGQPLFLIALLAIAIPVIVHLFNFRKYKKVYFTNVRYIAEITQETKKRNELKHLMILAARILAITALVFAFAKPFIPSPFQTTKTTDLKHVSIFIDNSFSMEALTNNGSLLDESKNKAIEIANAYNPSDLFQLLTGDFEGRHQRFVSREEYIRLVHDVKISPAVRNISNVMTRQAENLTGKGRNSMAYIISDFQKSISIFPEKHDTSVNWGFVPVVPAKINNLYIDSAWFDNPSHQPLQSVKLHVNIKNSSYESYEKIPLKLTINGVQKAVSGFSVANDGEIEVILTYSNDASGFQSGILEITDYPVTWDDTFYLSYKITPSIPVLCINESEENKYINALFGEDSAFVFKNTFISQTDYSAFNNYTLIVINGIQEYSSGLIQELKRFTEIGGSVIIFPSEQTNLNTLNSFLSTSGIPALKQIDTVRMKVSDVNTLNPLFRDVFENQGSKSVIPENADLPVVFRHFTSSGTVKSNSDYLMKLQNGDVFLSVTNIGKGKIYLLFSPLNETATNFPRNSTFVPTLYKIALLSQGEMPLFETLSSEKGIELNTDTTSTSEVYKIKKENSEFEIIPETHRDLQKILLFVHDQIKEAGNYEVRSGKKKVRPVSYNYNRKESDLKYMTISELEQYMKREGILNGIVLSGKTAILGKQIRELSQGVPLWKYFIIAGLLFLLAEILLVRLLKD